MSVQERAEDQPVFGGPPAQRSEMTQPIASPFVPPSPAPPSGGPATGTSPTSGGPAGAPPGSAPPSGAPFPGGSFAGGFGAASPAGTPPTGGFSTGTPSSGANRPGAAAPGTPHLPPQRPANLEYLTAREQPEAEPDYGREHFIGPMRSSRTPQHRAGNGQETDAERTVAMPRTTESGHQAGADTTVPITRPTEPGHPANAETMVLPVFVTGKKEPDPPAPATPPRNQHDGILSASERGMLLFVAALLGAGTIAVVTMLGLSGGLKKNPVTPVPPPATATVPAPGAPGPVTSPSPSVSASASPTPSQTPSSSPPAVAKTAATRIASPTPALLGQPQPLAYCIDKTRGLDKAPGPGNSTWVCTTGHRSQNIPFTPDQVCQWQYGASTHAVVGSLADPNTWKCYK